MHTDPATPPPTKMVSSSYLWAAVTVVLALLLLRLLVQVRRAGQPTLPRVSSLHIYPIKGCAGVAVREARLDKFGLHGDRRWMIVNDAASR